MWFWKVHCVVSWVCSFWVMVRLSIVAKMVRKNKGAPLMVRSKWR